MSTVLRFCDPRVLLAATLLSASLTGCSLFDKKGPPLPGERIAVFNERSEVEPDTDMANVPVVLPAPVVNDAWPQSGGFADYAMQHLEIDAQPRIVWTADIGAGTTSDRILTTPPVIADGKVFVKDAESTVSAFRADTGQRLWSVTLKPEDARDEGEFGGGLTWYGGRLFVTTGFASVFALDPNTGGEIWRSKESAPIRGAPLAFADRVFAITLDGKLHALAAVDGADLWSFTSLQEVAGYVDGPSPAGFGDYVVAPFKSGELVAFHPANNRSIWNDSLVGRGAEARAFGNLADIRGRPVIDRGQVFAMGSAGQITSIDLASGQRRWERNFGGNQTPWVAGRFLFAITSRADVVAMDRDSGKVKWVTPLTQYFDEKRQKLILWGGPVLAGDRLLVTGTTGDLLALSPYTGEVMGKISLGAPTRLAPVIANRTIYVLTDSGRLIALR
ncbi:PQQ-binding-like beta-propeller repeat protein [Enhydrobacter sp.]|jgi:outer membrane protein assembly factor BamB|uniref:outer membrane protein assembly factor BamB family protein n=1 Tax=Enhydrobacter sp. TaxID=1894999 RepID=UPI002627D61F|nr:PQQ-binding-like beta-propeller repeat protein [Enhydrobacter sp.]WIM13280.1 MAG: outer membrane protein YfgL [Enhydrobacter sp.]